MTEELISYKIWSKNNIKVGDRVMISYNLKRDTDYAHCGFVTGMEKEKGNVGWVMNIEPGYVVNKITLPIILVNTNNSSYWYSFNWLQKI